MTGQFTKTIATVGALAAVSFLSAPWAGAGKIPGAGEEFQKRSQVTVGGSEYFVQGRITSVADNYYWVMQPSGSEIRLKVTDATNMVCPTRRGETTGQEKGIQFEPGDTEGFRIGNCPFKVGDYIKAETTDIGTASFIRVAKNNVPEHQVAMPKDLPGQAGMPGQYMWLPVPLGGLATSDADKRMVVSGDGQKLGHLERVIVDTRSGKREYGIVKLEESGRLAALPWESFRWVETEKLVNIPEEELQRLAETPVQIIPTKTQMVDIPTYSLDTLSMAKIRNYWEGEVTHPEKAAIKTYAAQWVKDVVQEFERRSSFRQAMQDDPYLPAKLARYLNDASEDLQQGKRFEAFDHFRRAFLKLDEAVDHRVIPKSTAEKIKSVVILHAPGQLVAALESPKKQRSIKMAEAIDIATSNYPGEVIDAEYLGQYGKPAYRIAIMAGTGVTRAIQVNAQTGEVVKDIAQPGHPMPGEPFR